MWKRVVAPTAVVSILWIAVSAITTYYMKSLYDSHARTVSENLTTIESCWAMRRDVWKLQVAVLGAQTDRSKEAIDEIKQVQDAFLSDLADAERTSLTSEEKILADIIRHNFESYQAFIDRKIINVDPKAPTTNQSDQADQAETLALAVTDGCRRLSQLNEQMIDQQAAENMRLNNWIAVLRVSFLVLGPLVGLVLGLWVARRLNRSISQISVTLRDASGKLDMNLGSLAVSASDELPVLQEQVQLVAGRIKKVVGQLEDARQRAVQSERLAAVGELAAGVAHEIRNPLTSVKLLVQSAAQKGTGLNEKQSSVILQEVSRMETMIQGLLDFARPPALRTVEHDLRQTVRRALNLVQGRAEHHKVLIVEDFPATPVTVNADPEQLHLVFVNLAINGIEAMPKGGTLEVAIHSDGKACRVVFRDHGTGIPPHLLERIFEPFVTSKDRGTGLGLAISRRVMQEHGGWVSASNAADGGATLCVELAHACPQRAEPSPASSPEESLASILSESAESNQTPATANK
jgi:signal transduction histidine kinase